MGNNYNDNSGTSKTNFKIGKLEIDSSLLTNNDKLVLNPGTSNSVLQKSSTGTMSFVPLNQAKSTAVLQTTSPITLTWATNGSSSNGNKFSTFINPPAPNTLDSVIVTYSGTAQDTSVTVTPNDGTNTNLNTEISTGISNLLLRQICYRSSDNSFYAVGYSSSSPFTTRVLKLDINGNILSNWTYGTYGTQIVYDSTQDAIWILEGNSTPKTLKKLNASDGTQIGTTISVANASGVTSMIYDSLNNYIWISDSISSYALRKYNAATGALIGTTALSVGLLNIEMDTTNNVLWGGTSSSTTLRKISTGATPAITNSYAVGININALKYLPSTNELWIASFINSSDNVKTVNTSTGVATTIATNLQQYTGSTSTITDLVYNTVDNTMLVAGQGKSFVFNVATKTLSKAVTNLSSVTRVYKYSSTSNAHLGLVYNTNNLTKVTNTPNPVTLTSAEFATILNNSSLANKFVSIVDPSNLKINKTATGGSSTVLQDNGNGDNLSAYFYDGSDGLKSLPYQSGTNGELQFKNNTDFLSDPSLFWDNSGKRLGIGTSSPTYPLTVTGIISTDTWYRFADGTTQSTAAIPGINFLTGPTNMSGSYYGTCVIGGTVTLTGSTVIHGDLILMGSTIDAGVLAGTNTCPNLTVVGNVYATGSSASIISLSNNTNFGSNIYDGVSGGIFECSGNVQSTAPGSQIIVSGGSQTFGDGGDGGSIFIAGNLVNFTVNADGGTGASSFSGGNGGLVNIKSNCFSVSITASGGECPSVGGLGGSITINGSLSGSIVVNGGISTIAGYRASAGHISVFNGLNAILTWISGNSGGIGFSSIGTIEIGGSWQLCTIEDTGTAAGTSNLVLLSDTRISALSTNLSHQYYIATKNGDRLLTFAANSGSIGIYPYKLFGSTSTVDSTTLYQYSPTGIWTKFTSTIA